MDVATDRLNHLENNTPDIPVEMLNSKRGFLTCEQVEEEIIMISESELLLNSYC